VCRIWATGQAVTLLLKVLHIGHFHKAAHLGHFMALLLSFPLVLRQYTGKIFACQFGPLNLTFIGVIKNSLF